MNFRMEPVIVGTGDGQLVRSLATGQVEYRSLQRLYGSVLGRK